MPRLEAAIYTILSGTTALTDHVGTRIYPSYLPQNCTYPAMTYWRVSTIRESAMNADPGISTARFQVSVWATDPVTAGNVADHVRTAMHRTIGTYGGVKITDNAIDGEMITYDSETEEHQVALDFLVSQEET